MSDLREAVKRYTIKYDHKIKSICAPLQECLGISSYSYFEIEQDGRLVHISNHAEGLDFFYTEKLYLTDPDCCHPHLLRSGYLLIPDFYDPTFMRVIRSQVRLRDVFVIIQSSEGITKGSFFATPACCKSNMTVFTNHINLLRKFTHHFKKEAKSLIEWMRRDGFNMKKAKGEAFLKNDPLHPLSNNDLNVQRFLKLVEPLSHRERQCLDFFKQGKSAQATGALLGLSQRTIEFYFDNIKNKLGCRTKAELLEW